MDKDLQSSNPTPFDDEVGQDIDSIGSNSPSQSSYKSSGHTLKKVSSGGQALNQPVSGGFPPSPLPSSNTSSGGTSSSSSGQPVNGTASANGSGWSISNSQPQYIIGHVATNNNTISAAGQAIFTNQYVGSIKKAFVGDSKPFEVKDEYGNSLFSYDETEDGVIIEINKNWPSNIYGMDTRVVIMNENDKLIVTLKGARKMIK